MVVPLLVQAVDVPLDFGDDRVARVRAAGDALVPEQIVLLVLAAHKVQQARPFVRVIHLRMVPTLDRGLMQFGDGVHVDHGLLPLVHGQEFLR